MLVKLFLFCAAHELIEDTFEDAVAEAHGQDQYSNLEPPPE